MTRETNAKNSVSSATDRYREATDPVMMIDSPSLTLRIVSCGIALDGLELGARGHLRGPHKCERVDQARTLALHITMQALASETAEQRWLDEADDSSTRHIDRSWKQSTTPPPENTASRAE